MLAYRLGRGTSPSFTIAHSIWVDKRAVRFTILHYLRCSILTCVCSERCSNKRLTHLSSSLFPVYSPRVPASWKTPGSRGNDFPPPPPPTPSPPGDRCIRPKEECLSIAPCLSPLKRGHVVCVGVRECAYVGCACVCVCSSGTKTTTTTCTHTRKHTALNPGGNHFSEMSRFYELKHCDGRDDFYH